MSSDEFSVENRLFDRLTGLGEQLLGEALARVLKKAGVMGERDPVSGWRLLKAAQDYLWDTRDDEEKVRQIKDDARHALEHVQHAQRYAKTKACFCRDLVSGEHAADPICSVCALKTAENRLKKAISVSS